MSTLSIVNQSGSAAGEVSIDDAWLEREKGEQAVHETVVAYLAGRRAGTACTKTRGKVRGGGAKPYRQKGTGNARAGSNRSPVWRGGGTIFGPQPRSYAKKVNKKVRRLALRRAFTERLDAEAVMVADSAPALDKPSTKAVAAWLDAIGAGQHTLIIANEVSEALVHSVRNLPKVAVVPAGSLGVYQLLLHRKVLILQDAIEPLGQRLS